MIWFIIAVLICLYGIKNQFSLTFILANNGNGEGAGGSLITALIFCYLLGYTLYTNLTIVW